MEEQCYTPKQIIKMYDITTQTLNNWRRTGTIKYKKINKRNFLYFLPETKIIQENNESSKNL
jgi:predicted site-specific integrase-resolvase